MNNVNARDCNPVQDFRTEEEKKLDRQYDIIRMNQLGDMISLRKFRITYEQNLLREAEEEYSRLHMKLLGAL